MFFFPMLSIISTIIKRFIALTTFNCFSFHLKNSNAYAIITFKLTNTKFHCFATQTCGVQNKPAKKYIITPGVSGSKWGAVIKKPVPIYPNLFASLSVGESFLCFTRLFSHFLFNFFDCIFVTF